MKYAFQICFTTIKAKLQKLAEEILQDINKETVKFKENFCRLQVSDGMKIKYS